MADETKKKKEKAWEAVQPLVDEYKKLREITDKLAKSKEDLSEEAKIEEEKARLIEQNIRGVQEQRNVLVESYYKVEDSYMEQQRLIKKIAWMTEQKKWAVEEDKRKRQQEEEEKARKPVHPHAEEMEACDQLIAFCKRRMGVDKRQEEKKVVIPVAEKSLIGVEGKAVPMEDKRKKEEELLIIGGTGKKKGKNRNDRKKAKPKEELRLDIDIGTLQLFDMVQVQPPLSFKTLPETVQKLEEKKKYFDELPAEPEKKEEKTEDKKEEVEQKEPEEKKPE